MLPPEQVYGKAEFKSDIYSLAKTAVHLLTGLNERELLDPVTDSWLWVELYDREYSDRDFRLLLESMMERATGKRPDASAVLGHRSLSGNDSSNNSLEGGNTRSASEVEYEIHKNSLRLRYSPYDFRAKLSLDQACAEYENLQRQKDSEVGATATRSPRLIAGGSFTLGITALAIGFPPAIKAPYCGTAVVQLATNRSQETLPIAIGHTLDFLYLCLMMYNILNGFRYLSRGLSKKG